MIIQKFSVFHNFDIIATHSVLQLTYDKCGIGRVD